MDKKKIKVLVVDDEKTVRDFFKRFLPLLELEVTEAEDGYKAVEAVKTNKFDLYFIDARMPGLNGLETYRRIRQIDPDAVVIMITGYAIEDILEEAQKEGIQCYIRKPFDINQIKEAIKIGIDRRKIAETLNILVVDDDETILNFFSAFLKEKNQRFQLARDKNEALAAARKEKFDLIFLDLVLKDTNGVDVYKEVRSILPEVDIVLITGYPQEAKKIENEIEFAGCLYKPFEMESIVKYIEMAKSK